MRHNMGETWLGRDCFLYYKHLVFFLSLYLILKSISISSWSVTSNIFQLEWNVLDARCDSPSRSAGCLQLCEHQTVFLYAATATSCHSNPRASLFVIFIPSITNDLQVCTFCFVSNALASGKCRVECRRGLLGANETQRERKREREIECSSN